MGAPSERGRDLPAVRSRTENWRRSLEQLAERQGSIELALAASEDAVRQGASASGEVDLMWRVRVRDVGDDGIRVDTPTALGRSFEFGPGTDVVGVIAIGQNRWMFRTSVVSLEGEQAITLAPPKAVERCQRRSFYRASTASLSLPKVWAAPLLSLDNIVEAEHACREAVLQIKRRDVLARIEGEDEGVSDIEPHTGPGATASLVNLGGGGVGLLFEPDDARVVAPQRQLYMRLRLPPHVPAPLVVIGRVRHSHIDSQKRVYAGVAFDFGHHGGYREFVVDQLCRYVALVQRRQRESAAEADQAGS